MPAAAAAHAANPAAAAAYAAVPAAAVSGLDAAAAAGYHQRLQQQTHQQAAPGLVVAAAAPPALTAGAETLTAQNKDLLLAAAAAANSSPAAAGVHPDTIFTVSLCLSPFLCLPFPLFSSCRPTYFQDRPSISDCAHGTIFPYVPFPVLFSLLPFAFPFFSCCGAAGLSLNLAAGVLESFSPVEFEATKVLVGTFLY